MVFRIKFSTWGKSWELLRYVAEQIFVHKSEKKRRKNVLGAYVSIAKERL